MNNRIRTLLFDAAKWIKTSKARTISRVMGASMLAGGIGVIRFAEEQQQAVPTEENARLIVWTSKVSDGLWPSSVIYGVGVLLLTLGAGLLTAGFSNCGTLPRVD